MNYPRILNQLYGTPLLLTPQGHAAVSRVIHSRLGRSSLDPKAEREGKDISGDAVEIPQARIEDGIGIVPVGGIIGTGLGKIEKGWGAVGVEDIQAELKTFAADPAVKAIIMEFDSPGGMVSGTPETADLVANLWSVKPIYSFVAGQMCSAAYWIGAATRGIFCTPTSDVGSIGVYLAFYDERKAYEDMGIFAKIFRSGKFKGMGAPGTSLTDDQSTLLQERVDQIAEMFKAHVRSFRGDVDDGVMQGQSFMGMDAVKNGLADGIVSNMEEMKQMILAQVGH